MHFRVVGSNIFLSILGSSEIVEYVRCQCGFLYWGEALITYQDGLHRICCLEWNLLDCVYTVCRCNIILHAENKRKTGTNVGESKIEIG